jgi:cell fate (sporulation/competence/biofilm development) regulator YmcA (YheA/YmcA/DUF963 family)
MADRNELLAEANELAELLLKTPEISAYRLAEKNMKADPATESKIRKLRELTDQVGEFRARNVPFKHYEHLLKDSEALLNELQSIPEVRAFQEAQTAINELLQTVTNRLSRGVMIPPQNEQTE